MLGGAPERGVVTVSSSGPPDRRPSDHRGPSPRVRQAVKTALSVLLVAGIFYVLFTQIDFGDVWAEVRAMTWLELTLLLAIAVWNLATYALVWMTVTPGLSFGQAMLMTQLTTAVSNTVPGGAAVGVGMTYSMFGRWGYSRSKTTTAVLVSGVWNSFIKLGLPVFALAVVAVHGGASSARLIPAVVGLTGLVAAVVVFGAMLHSEQVARRVGVRAGRVASRLLAVVHRPPVAGWEIATVKFRARTVDLLQRGWVPITVTSLLSHLSLYLVLLVALRQVGMSEADVSWAEVLAVFAFARLATAVPFTPGGAGVVEAVLIGGLVAAGGEADRVTAAVLVYRGLTWALPIVVGVGCYAWWRRQVAASRAAGDPGRVGAAGTAGDRFAQPGRPRGRWVVGAGYARHPGDALRLVLGVAVLLLTTAAVHVDYLGSREAALFRLVNELALPDWTWPGVWLLMQLGVVGAVPLVAAAALLTRRLRLALDAVLAAGSIYLVAKVIKQFVQRGRPDTLLDDVNILGEPAGGLGYVSGHSAVAVALATVSSPYLGRRGRRVAWALAVTVCLARMYVGAHLPFDVLGGAALGWAAGALVHLVLGAPESRPPAGRVREALQAHGIETGAVQPLPPRTSRSTRFTSGGDPDPGLFVKVVVREWRDTDLIYRAWRRLRRAGHPVRQRTPVHEVEHEALMAMLARAAGVRAPGVPLVTSFGNGAGLLVEERIDGRTLTDLDADRIDDGLLADLRRQVAALHRAGIAHQDLSADNIIVDRDRRTWLVDFDQAVAGAPDGRIARDEQALQAILTDVASRRHGTATRAAATPPDPQPSAAS
jgi:uncharacterized protein (TIRG00374 family)